MKTIGWVVLFAFGITGCALMEKIGISTADGEPTDMARNLDALLYGLTGFSATRVWDAVLTKRGLQNTKNVISPKTGFLSSLSSVAAILLGFHSPDEVRKARDAELAKNRGDERVLEG
jgi:hypothetical protein